MNRGNRSTTPVQSTARQLAGWGGAPVATCRVYRPAHETDLTDILHQQDEQSFIARGLGRSYGDASINASAGVIDQTHLARFVELDAERGVVTCEAGVSIEDLITALLPRGFFPPVTPGTKHITVGGAIAADVHGKNHHIAGTFGNHVVAFSLMTASGEILRCSRDENRQLFDATLGGMGLTGVILTAQIAMRRVESAFVKVEYERVPHLDRALERFAATDASSTYSVAWIDGLATGRSLGRSILMRGEHILFDDLPARVQHDRFQLHRPPRLNMPVNAPSWLLNSWSVRAFNRLYYARHSDCTRIEHFERFFYPLDSIRNWNRLYGRRGFLQYQVAFPERTSRAALVDLLERLARSRRSSFLAVLKSFGDAGDGWLSFPIKGHTLALDLPNTGDDLAALLHELNRDVIRYDGRVYLAKDAILNAEECAAMYSRLTEFISLKRRIDPENRFSSSLSRRVGITPQ